MKPIHRAVGLMTIILWSFLTVAVWRYHRSSISVLVPLDRVPWVPQSTDAKLDVLPKLLLSNGLWTPSPARMNDTLVWGQKTPDNDCLGPSALVNGHVRSQDVDGWQWVLEDGSSLSEFDIEQFVVRGLQSRIGYVLVGDSLTEGIAAALEMLLLMPNPLMEPKLVTRLWDHGPVRWKDAKGPHPWSSNMTLSPRHPLTQRITARWESGEDEELMNVPRDRLSRPFVRHFRSSNLASEEEMAEVIVEGMGVNVDWTVQLRIPTPWRDRLRLHTNEPSWEGERPAIVLVNTGPHWEPDRFKPIPESQMMEAYKLVMKKLYESLQTFPEDLPLRFMYRSTMPGHENCYKFHYPVTKFEAAARDPTGERNRTYHWHWFPDYNAFAKELWGNGLLSINHNRANLDEEQDDLETRANLGKRGAALTTEYWDIWNLSATRPDAHIAWNGNHVDCLHFCPAGIYQWVVRAWWHTITTEGY